MVIETDKQSIRDDYYHRALKILQDGKLEALVKNEVPGTIFYPPDKYCIDNFVMNDNKVTVPDALICFSEKKIPNHLWLSATCKYVFRSALRLKKCISLFTSVCVPLC